MFVSKVCRYNYVRALRAVHSCAGKLSEDVEDVFKKFGDDVYYYDDNRGNCRRLIYGLKTDAYMMARAEKRSRKENKFPNPLPLSLRLVAPGYEEERHVETRNNVPEEAPKKWQFPFEASNAGKIEPVQHTESPARENLDELGLEIRTRLELHNKSPEHTAWMDDYENYSGRPSSTVEASVNYGTPDPKSAITATPCGGCGALLHCKDPAIPGYIPSEILGNFNRPGGLGLKELVCQRCHFLKTYDLALQVRVTAEDYPKVLRTIGEQHRALVLLIVDLLDFPCSIWPGIPDLIGHNRPIVAVGNKVDLLPQDDKKFLERVGRNLRDSLALSGFGTCNVKHVALVSAKTGYGIEDLITRLHSLWQYKGDVYIVGCTNVGKSTLFNALLQSDYCKSQAADLIQRATTSPWPGTTLNLLKFPILRPTGWRMHLRAQRLSSVRSLESKQRKLHLEQMKNNKDLSQATLIGHIGHTFMEQRDEEEEESEGYFAKTRPARKKFGIDEKHPDFATSKWCYDTPGVVQEDQVIHLLTTEELMLMLPKEIIRPKTFTLYSNSTIFIGGVARLDVLETSSSVRFTVFCSDKLPITVCATSKAEAIYDRLLDADALAVPTSHPDRLRVWPGLRSVRPFTVAGVDSNTSCCDVVLSNAGWIAVTPGRDQKCTVRGWTPERRGVHLRDSLLPKAVALRGDRIRRTCAYANNKFFVP